MVDAAAIEFKQKIEAFCENADLSRLTLKIVKEIKAASENLAYQRRCCRMSRSFAPAVPWRRCVRTSFPHGGRVVVAKRGEVLLDADVPNVPGEARVERNTRRGARLPAASSSCTS